MCFLVRLSYPPLNTSALPPCNGGLGGGVKESDKTSSYKGITKWSSNKYISFCFTHYNVTKHKNFMAKMLIVILLQRDVYFKNIKKYINLNKVNSEWKLTRISYYSIILYLLHNRAIITKYTNPTPHTPAHIHTHTPTHINKKLILTKWMPWVGGAGECQVSMFSYII